MKLAFWSCLGFALAVPALLVAIALGPVILGILCAVGFGFIVFVIANAVVGLVMAARGAERAGSRWLGHGSGSSRVTQ